MQIAASQPETGVSHQAGAFHRSGKPGRCMLYLQAAGTAYIALCGIVWRCMARTGALRGSASYDRMIGNV